MKIGFLTTSRADFGIYLPLIRRVDQHEDMECLIFAGGTHLSAKFGSTYKLIEDYGFSITEKVDSLIDDDSPAGIALSMAKTVSAFTSVWQKYAKDIEVLFVLGDRFEMFSAAAATVPFNIPLAHIHGGEVTLGSIDNKFRNAITAISQLHFASAKTHASRITAMIGSEDNVCDVGALSIESMTTTTLLSSEQFYDQFDFDIEEPYVLTTFHPETSNPGQSESHVIEWIEALKKIPEKVLCTLPNADAEGSIIRNKLLEFERAQPDKIKCFENLGQIGYYTAMKHCKLMIGNTSSGIIEAATFDTVVVDVGTRQEGRLASRNVIQAENNRDNILLSYKESLSLIGQKFKNVYGGGNSAAQIMEVLDQR